MSCKKENNPGLSVTKYSTHLEDNHYLNYDYFNCMIIQSIIILESNYTTIPKIMIDLFLIRLDQQEKAIMYV